MTATSTHQHPTTLPITPEHIPEELKQRDQWLVWRWYWLVETQKWTKVPYDPNTGFKASSTDSTTWATFDTALSVVGRYHGIGFVFTEDDPYAGVDLDECRDVETGEIEARAQAIVDDFTSYTESSVSGTGVHIVVRATVPGDRCKSASKHIEMYDHARFFVMTGHRFPGTPETIRQGQIPLDNLYADTFREPAQPQASGSSSHRQNGSAPPPMIDSDIIELCRKARNSAKFSALYDHGDLSAHNNDHSVADLALLGIMAFYTDDDHQLLRLWQGSNLDRPKLRQRVDYQERTIAKAREGMHEHYRAPGGPDATFRYGPGGGAAGRDGDDQRQASETPLSWSDEGNAQRLIQRRGADLRYVAEHASWYIWAGDRWAKDEREKVVEYARELPVEIFAEAADTTDPKRADSLVKFAVKSLNVSRVLAVPRLMRTDARITVAAEALDANPMLLNTPGGTVDCSTGELMPHDRTDLITKTTGSIVSPTSDCPLWMGYLDLVFAGDMDIIRFVQKLCGYTLTGMTTEQVFVLMHGPQGTGKTTFMNTLFGVMGGYATNADASTFMVKQRSGRATPEIARLQGARLISTSETEQGQRLAAALVKRFSGNTRITASNLYAPDFEFTPVGKIWVDTNHKPQIPQGDDAVWARLILVPFMVEIRHTARDRKGYAELMKHEWPGILRWMIDGCLAWQEEGLVRPKAVVDATKEYHEESDILGAFIRERCEVGPNLHEMATPLYMGWVDWAKSKNEKVVAYKEFRQQMIERNYHHRTIKTGSAFYGLSLLEDQQGTFTYGGGGGRYQE